MISETLLLRFGAELIEYPESTLVFSEKKKAHYFYQIKEGVVKMFNLNEQGKEFIQGMFYKNESFGEPPLFGNFNYPSSAITVEKSEIYRVSKKNLFKLLGENTKLHLEITSSLAKRLYYKSMILKEISGHTAEHRILTLIDFLKGKENTSKYKVDLTRQQIADLTGLRVETVIRAVKDLEKTGEIEIINRKVFR